MSERQEVAQCLELLIKQLLHGSDAQVVESLAEHDLSFSQVRILFALSLHEHSLAINELAAEINQSIATAGRNVDALVREGLVQRAENQADRRVKLVSLSTAGRELVDRKIGQRRNAVQAFADSLPADQSRCLLEALRPIVATFENRCLSIHTKVSDPLD